MNLCLQINLNRVILSLDHLKLFEYHTHSAKTPLRMNMIFCGKHIFFKLERIIRPMHNVTKYNAVNGQTVFLFKYSISKNAKSNVADYIIMFSLLGNQRLSLAKRKLHNLFLNKLCTTHFSLIFQGCKREFRGLTVHLFSWMTTSHKDQLEFLYMDLFPRAYMR